MPAMTRPADPPHAHAASDPTLSALAAEAWDVAMAAEPMYATVVGDHRFDDRLADNDPAAVDAVIARQEAQLERARTIAAGTLDGEDRVTAAALVAFLEMEIDLRRSRVATWTVDPLDGPQVAFLNLEAFQPVGSPAAREALLSRWAAMGPWLDRQVAVGREALRAGLVSPHSPVGRVQAQLDDLLAEADDASPLMAPARADWTEGSEQDRTRFAAALSRTIGEVIRPAFGRYRAFVADEVAPSARSDDRPGLVHVPGGVDAYARVARAHTSLDLSPEAIHAIGLDEVARVDDELSALAARVLGTRDRAEATRRLRSDPDLHFSTSAEAAAVARRSLARANDAIAGWFGVLPRAVCEVVEMPAFEAEHSTIAYYRDPDPDGSRPGQYYINVSRPETRPRYEAEALAFHESVPGHHLQLAIAQEIEGLPDFRRLSGTTAYIEGWGLYTERLADDMGLYTGDLDRLGVLSFDGWRACRLVVDTGMHALGWTRQQAIDFMVEHTALAPNNVANEVDRYISMPGQALAYKLGQLELLRLRSEAREALGARFDIRAFHDAVLTQGALPLPALRQVIGDWIAAS
jgi:uncharacterized protein (DUF885 family)